MSRVRWALLALAIAIALPVAALVSRALDSAETERRMRHQAVAHRAFDEMERVLSLWLEREEARPFTDYRFYVDASLVGASGSNGAPLSRSPLSRVPNEPFVIGAFQIEPDGSVRTPLQPADVVAAQSRGDWPPPADMQTRIDRVLELAGALPEHARRPRPAASADINGLATPAVRELAAPASPARKRVDPTMASDTRDLHDAAAGLDVAERKEAFAAKQEARLEEEMPAGDAAPSEAGYATYRALEKLNLASSQRADRRQKVQNAQNVQEEKRYDAFAPSLSAEPTSSPAPEWDDASTLGRLSSAQADADIDAGSRAAAEAPPARAPKDSSDVGREAIRVAIDPMTGVALPTATPLLALYRTVLFGAQGLRQGLIIDLDGLGETLDLEVVRAGGLAGVADVTFGWTGASGELRPGPGYSFVHRFAEPFDALSVRLDLAPLDEVADERRVLLLLVGLIAVLSVGGLLVVDRMTRVVVEFAERRSNFVAAVSHELKTPLTSIRMYAEMLRDGLVPSEEKRSEYYATISDESERLTRLINNVLEFSRLEKGRAALSLVAGDVSLPILEAARHLAPHAEREGFTLRVDIADGLPPVRFDRDALVQVVFNLVDNAVKYAASATRRDIVLSVQPCDGGVELSVRDFGPGVPAQQLRRVFEPFHRGESELTRSAKGTGIGLALVAELADAMHARVVAENASDGGFRIWMVLPAG